MGEREVERLESEGRKLFERLNLLQNVINEKENGRDKLEVEQEVEQEEDNQDLELQMNEIEDQKEWKEWQDLDTVEILSEAESK